MTQILNLVNAIDSFITGCKSDGTWNSIKASCIIAGWSNLSGALTPLVGVAPSGFNLASGTYSRVTGLKGDGAAMYLNSNRNNNADPQNSKHVAVYVSILDPASSRPFLGLNRLNTDGPGASLIYNSLTRLHDALTSSYTASGVFIGLNRSASGSYTRRADQANTSISATSTTPTVPSIVLYADNLLNAPVYSASALSFYSIGESLNLALLDARVSGLMVAISGAIA